MIRAVIDVGSNSIKMRAARITQGQIKLICDETEVVKLGRGMNAGSSPQLREDSMKRSCDAVKRMVKKAEKYGAEIFIAGTMALRTAKNADEFLKMVKSSTGHEVHVLTGEQEARYSWKGATEGFNINGNTVMFDTGGGSTEFAYGVSGVMKEVVSIPVGAVNLTEKFFSNSTEPVKLSTCDNAVKYVQDILNGHSIVKTASSLSANIIGVGGGVVAMSGVKNACEYFMPSKLHGSILTLRDVKSQIKLYSSLKLDEREGIIGLPPSRADVILGSACIVYSLLNVLGAGKFTVSINGLRQGLLLSDVFSDI